MRYLGWVICVVLLIQQQGSPVQVEASDGFIRTRGVHFVMDGSPYYANGFNAYWLMYLASDPSQRAKVSAAFHEASTHGLTVARTWAFSDGGYRPLQYSPGFYNQQMFKVRPPLFLFISLLLILMLSILFYILPFSSVLKGLDFVIAEARRYRIKLILSLVNNYESFGGKKQYVNWARSRGQYLSSVDDFFRNPVVKGYYKNHVKVS